jgi:plasmid stability protein
MMAVQAVTFHLPSPLYERLKQRAEQTHRSVEAELLEVVAAAVPVADDLPADLAQVIAPLAPLDDKALWRAARSHLPAEAAAQMEQLHLKRQRQGLTGSEAEALAGIAALHLNRPSLVKARQAWVSVAWHPPTD